MKNYLILLGAALCLSTGVTAEPRPDGWTKASKAFVATTYAGKTRIWSKGGVYYSKDKKAYALWDKHVATGTWRINSKGSLCRTLTWWSKGEAEVTDEFCELNIVGPEGNLWTSDLSVKKSKNRENEWHQVTNKKGKNGKFKLSNGNAIKKKFDRIYKKQGPKA